MASLSLRRPHGLGAREARVRVERAAAKLTARFGANCSWQGTTLAIDHPGVSGTVTVGEAEILVEARLAPGLGLLRRRAEAELTRILDRELAA